MTRDEGRVRVLAGARRAGHDQPAHGQLPQHRFEAAVVVGVRVGEDHPVQRVDPAAAELVEERVSRGAAVDEPGPPVGPLHERGVALPHREEADLQPARGGGAPGQERRGGAERGEGQLATEDHGERQERRPAGSDRGVPGFGVEEREAAQRQLGQARGGGQQGLGHPVGSELGGEDRRGDQRAQERHRPQVRQGCGRRDVLERERGDGEGAGRGADRAGDARVEPPQRRPGVGRHQAQEAGRDEQAPRQRAEAELEPEPRHRRGVLHEDQDQPERERLPTPRQSTPGLGPGPGQRHPHRPAGRNRPTGPDRVGGGAAHRDQPGQELDRQAPVEEPQRPQHHPGQPADEQRGEPDVEPGDGHEVPGPGAAEQVPGGGLDSAPVAIHEGTEETGVPRGAGRGRWPLAAHHTQLLGAQHRSDRRPREGPGRVRFTREAGEVHRRGPPADHEPGARGGWGVREADPEPTLDRRPPALEPHGVHVHVRLPPLGLGGHPSADLDLPSEIQRGRQGGRGREPDQEPGGPQPERGGPARGPREHQREEQRRPDQARPEPGLERGPGRHAGQQADGEGGEREHDGGPCTRRANG